MNTTNVPTEQRYHFAKNINNTGQTGIIDLETFKVICLCDKEGSELILNALKQPTENVELEEFAKWIIDNVYSINDESNLWNINNNIHPFSEVLQAFKNRNK